VIMQYLEAQRADRTTGFERPCGVLYPATGQTRVERMTGVPTRQIERAAHILGEAATAMLLTGRGSERRRRPQMSARSVPIGLSAETAVSLEFRDCLAEGPSAKGMS
jgi:hypothetical protein